MGRDKVQRRERVQAGSQEGWRWWVHLAASVLGSEVVLLRRGLAVWALDPETAVLVVEGELLGVEGLRAPGRGLLSQSLGVAGVGERGVCCHRFRLPPEGRRGPRLPGGKRASVWTWKSCHPVRKILSFNP